MKRLLRWMLALAVAFSLLYVIAEQAGWLSESQVAYQFQWLARHEHGRLAAGVWLYALLAGDLILPVPSTLAVTAGGSMLGWAWGALSSGLGMLTGSAIGYFICLRFGRRAFVRLVEGGDAERVRRLFDRYGAWAIVLGRAIPMLPEIMSCLSGLVRFPPRRYFALSLAGIIPFALLFSWAGDRGTREHESYWLALSVLVPAAGLAAIAFTKFIRRRRRPPS